MEKENLLIILGAIGLASFGFSWLFGYFQLQWYFAIGIFGGIFGALYFSHRKVMKVYGWRVAIEKNREDLKAMGIISDVGYRVVRVSRVDEHLDLNDRGKYWYILFGNGPDYQPLVFSVKSAKVMHLDVRGVIDESPLKSAREKPIPPQVQIGTTEIRYEEKTKPEKKQPSPQ